MGFTTDIFGKLRTYMQGNVAGSQQPIAFGADEIDLGDIAIDKLFKRLNTAPHPNEHLVKGDYIVTEINGANVELLNMIEWKKKRLHEMTLMPPPRPLEPSELCQYYPIPFGCNGYFEEYTEVQVTDADLLNTNNWRLCDNIGASFDGLPDPRGTIIIVPTGIQWGDEATFKILMDGVCHIVNECVMSTRVARVFNNAGTFEFKHDPTNVIDEFNILDVGRFQVKTNLVRTTAEVGMQVTVEDDLVDNIGNPLYGVSVRYIIFGPNEFGVYCFRGDTPYTPHRGFTMTFFDKFYGDE